MLQFIRDGTQGWLTQAVIGLLVLVLILWGLHGVLERHPVNNEGQAVASLEGQTLSQHDFHILYQRLYQQTQNRLGSAAVLDEGLVRKLKKQTLEQWALMQVLVRAAQQEGYRISPAKIDAVLLAMPVFHLAGRFSSTRFYTVLRSTGYTESQFLADLKKTLLMNQVQQSLTQTAFLLPGELARVIALVEQTRSFAYASISSREFLKKQRPVPDSQAFAYYDRHQKQFIQTEQVRIDYVKLSLQPIKGGSLFVENREILANVAYANPHSLERVAKKLGLAIQSTHWFDRTGGRDQFTRNSKIISAAFSPRVLQGNNSAVIDLDADTALILRIKQHQAPAAQPFSAVKAQIIQTLKKRLAAEKTRRVGEELLSQLKARGGSLSDQADPFHLRWHHVHQATLNTSILSPVVLQAVFDLPRPQKIGKPTVFGGLALANGDYLLVQLLSVQDGHDAHPSSARERTWSKALENSFGQLDYELYARSFLQTVRLT